MKALITTQHRGVFAGEIDDGQDLGAKAMPIRGARMAIRFGTTRGLMQLAETGPTPQRVGAPWAAVKPLSAQPPVNSPPTVRPEAAADSR